MCGIAGIVSWQEPPSREALAGMERAILHRGPDEGHIWQSGPCGLVHRRLRIIDLSPAAAQPMSNEDGSLWVAFNGEIYNFQELRRELEPAGHQFKSRSDTEVLVHGYETWGTDLFRRLRGMFAIALWDVGQKRLIVARDRLGKKPLYYHQRAGLFAFGSELGCFKSVPGLDLQLDANGFAAYLEYGYVPSPGSLLRGIERVPAGQFGVSDAKGFRLESYWSLPITPFQGKPSGSARMAAEELDGVLGGAVEARLISDVPLGCFLSGGVDSSLVAAYAQKALGSTRLKTYTVGFEGTAQNEAPMAARIAKHLGTEHHLLNVSTKTILAEYENVLRMAGEPVGDDSFVPTFLISRATREHVTVALSGDGGDELFGGYEKYAQFEKARRLRSMLPLPWGLLAKWAWSDRSRKSFEALGTGSGKELARWLSSLWKRNELPGLILNAGIPPRDHFDTCWDDRGEFEPLERWMLTDMENYLEGGILTKVDRASMLVALEGRSPFLDSEFVDKVLRIPLRADLASGGKAILKELLAKFYPREWFSRPKQGFGMPVAEWYRGELKGTLLKYTDRKRLEQRGLVNAEVVKSTVRAHLDGQSNHARKLHALVAFEAWADEFFGPGVALGAAGGRD